LVKLGNASPANTQICPAFFIVTMLKFLPATATEHLTKRLELYEIPRSDHQAEVPVQAKETQEVGSVPDRDRCTTGLHKAPEYGNRTRLPDLHKFGHVERQHLGEIVVREEGVLYVESDEVVPAIGVA
jgi:hypothetical protein